MEISVVRQRFLRTAATARERSRRRRIMADEASGDYRRFLDEVATPLVRQLASILKAENHAFTVFTPGDGLRLALDRSRDDYIEFALDTTGDHPVVSLSVGRTRGSRTLREERPISDTTGPADLTEDEVLSALLAALEPWLER